MYLKLATNVLLLSGLVGAAAAQKNGNGTNKHHQIRGGSSTLTPEDIQAVRKLSDSLGFLKKLQEDAIDADDAGLGDHASGTLFGEHWFNLLHGLDNVLHHIEDGICTTGQCLHRLDIDNGRTEESDDDDDSSDTEHSHTFTGDGHTHSFTGDGHTHSFTGDGHTHSFTGDGHTHSFTGDGHQHTLPGFNFVQCQLVNCQCDITCGTPNANQVDSGDATGTTDPGDATGTTDPGDATGTTDPGDATGTTDPGDATGTTDPGDATGTTDPGDATGTTDPAAAPHSHSLEGYSDYLDQKFNNCGQDVLDAFGNDECLHDAEPDQDHGAGSEEEHCIGNGEPGCTPLGGLSNCCAGLVCEDDGNPKTDYGVCRLPCTTTACTENTNCCPGETCLDLDLDGQAEICGACLLSGIAPIPGSYCDDDSDCCDVDTLGAKCVAGGCIIPPSD